MGRVWEASIFPHHWAGSRFVKTEPSCVQQCGDRGNHEVHSLSSRRWHTIGPQGREPKGDYQSVRLRARQSPTDYSVLEKYYRRGGIGFTGITHLLQMPNSVCRLGTCSHRLLAQIAPPSSLQTAKAAAAPPRVVAVGRLGRRLAT